MNDIETVFQNYRTWGFMDPDVFHSMMDFYANNGGEVHILEEGTLLDSTLLIPGENQALPVFIAFPYATTTWTSVYQVHSWTLRDAPQLVWNMWEESQDDEPGAGLMSSYRHALLDLQ